MLRRLLSRFLSALRPSPARTAPSAAGVQPAYAGDFGGTATVEYRPNPDGDPDPGEIVWTWVPFEEDHSQGKDRPVLIVGRRSESLLALMLTSKDHNGGGRARDYIDIGSGTWDPQRRPSEVRLDRVLQIDPATVRREGAVLDRGRFGLVADGLRARWGWR